MTTRMLRHKGAGWWARFIGRWSLEQQECYVLHDEPQAQ